MLLDKHLSKCLLGYYAPLDRVLLVKLKGHPFNMPLTHAYKPTSYSSEQDLEMFYELLYTPKQQFKSKETVLVMGNFSAR